MMSGNVSVQSGHLSSPQQQSVTQIQLQQQLQQQQPQPDPTKSVQWQISTSSAGSASAGSHASQQSVNKVSCDPNLGPMLSGFDSLLHEKRFCISTNFEQ